MLYMSKIDEDEEFYKIPKLITITLIFINSALFVIILSLIIDLEYLLIIGIILAFLGLVFEFIHFITLMRSKFINKPEYREVDKLGNVNIYKSQEDIEDFLRGIIILVMILGVIIIIGIYLFNFLFS